MTWHALVLQVEPSAREAVEYALMEAGASGTETSDQSDKLLQITGYFSTVPERELVRFHLFEALRIYDLPSSSVRDMTVQEVVERDWLAEWKQSWKPVEVGRFVITPPWIQIPERDGRLVVTIEPGMAFGTGTHETTRLCLAAIEKYFVGSSFLDVGTGTGVLAIAAAKLRPSARVDACDIDSESISVARQNAVINKVEHRINFTAGTVDEVSASADLVCANLTADVIIQILPKLLSVTCGRLVLSGVLSDQLESVRERLASCGVPGEIDELTEGDWVTLIV